MECAEALSASKPLLNCFIAATARREGDASLATGDARLLESAVVNVLDIRR